MPPPPKPRLGRPNAARVLARGDGRELIASTALKAFSEQGYHDVSVRDIARTAGVSLSAMYHYYPGKQDLLYDLLQSGIETYNAICRDALENAAVDPLSRLDALVEANVRYRADHKIESNLTLRESRNLDAALQRKLRAPQIKNIEQWDAIIAEGLHDGVFTTPYPVDARRAVLDMCNAIARWYEPGGEVALPELVTRYQHLARALVGYSPKSASTRTRRPR